MIRDDATRAQVDAANPRNSTWLSANAGSGKTRVLTDRVARLLLEQVDPQNILCLTYTKAAAAEMQNRLFQRLGDWAMMDDNRLRHDLAKLGFERAVTTDELSRARRLFAQAIETPGGLKIQTIHAFCASVLRRFPLEAGVSPQFREMEDRQAELLRAEVLDELLQGDQAQAVRDLLAIFTGTDLADLTGECASRRELFAQDSDKTEIHRALELPPDAIRADALSIAFDGGEEDLVNDIVKAFKDQSKMYQSFAEKLRSLSLRSPEFSALDTLFELFLYADSKASKSANFPQSRHTKAVDAIAPIADDLHAWMDRVAAAYQYLLRIDAAERAVALANFGRAFVPAFETRKSAMGVLDFDDLIQKTKALLTDRRVAQWVLFRLDGGIDHVLVDEAQDTSPDQWAVIKQLTQEFTAGEGADPSRERTIFVVGDKKQSIYSFQGADPDAFDQMRHHFAEGLKAVGDTLHPGSLLHSFRSSQAVLRVVDETFKGDRAAGLEPNVQHLSFKSNMPGRVDLWPVIEPSEQKTDYDWTAPVDTTTPDHHHVRLASRIATDIQRMIQSETIPSEIGDTGTFARRKITPGDILILVQRRSELFSEIIRACKALNLDIAGADRLRIGAELAVKDIAALLSFLALPEDDLSLAAVLKSPLFGWSEKAVFEIAYPRPKGGYLWAALRSHDSHRATKDILDDLRSSAEFLRPYDLIDRILTRHDGRRKLLARLGAEAEDGIDALLTQALAYESTGAPNLTGFLNWMATDDLEIKRQMDSQGDKIRVMTVHGAKGLEAPIVILPETAKRANTVRREILNANGTPLWKPKANATPDAIAAVLDQIKAKQLEERMRLLYVAMTRAETWLIVAAAGDVGDENDSWYRLVESGMAHTDVVDVTIGEETIRRVSHMDWEAGDIVTKDVSKPADLPHLPLGDLPKPTRITPRAPSDLGGAKILPGDPGEGDQDAAMARGTALHLLLEHLPQVPSTKREAFGATLLSGRDDAALLVTQAIDILNAPHLQDIFTPAALTEVDVTAALPALKGVRIRGAIDRLIVNDTSVLAIDYKSNRAAPSTPEQTPDGLLRQMGAYQAALIQIFPHHQVDTAILWTETAALMRLPAQLTAEALAQVTDA